MNAGLAPTGLPVEEVIGPLRHALTGAGHAVLTAAPGAGKTTVVPLRLLDEPWLAGRRILVLEPRRLATRAAARRMSALLGEPVGQTVGYRTRDERRVSAATRVEVVTEGILTRRLQHDPGLEGVGLVIFDEFHERSLHGDLGLALTLDVRRSLRSDLAVLVMSATLDAARVAALLGDWAPGGPGEAAPVVSSDGRLHPVELRWAPVARRERQEVAVAAAVRRALAEDDSGDLLVFLPGAAAIRRTHEELAGGALPADVEVRPLFGGLAAHDQDAAIAASEPGRRKVVLSTDIAETSLTVEGVRTVIDAGQSRVPRHDARTGMTALATVTASRDSAEQRAGRAGRLAPGVAVRLWSKVEHGARKRHSDAEITQVDLAGLVLELAAWGVDDPAALPFCDPPPPGAWREGRDLLERLGALDAAGRITAAGRAMVELPVHPRLAHLLLGACERGQGWLGCLVAALLEDRDVLRGHPDELPADLAVRLELLEDPGRRHPRADGRALRSARERAHDLARRVDTAPGGVDLAAAGAVLALAYPDRVAQARGGRGRYRLRSGTAAWVANGEVLAGEELLVVAALDGDRRDARIRIAAPLHPDELAELFGDQLVVDEQLVWDRERDDLVVRVQRRLDNLTLATVDRRPEPGAATAGALTEHVRAVGLGALGWDEPARSLRARVACCRRHLGQDWPDLSDGALLAGLDQWLTPLLAGATGRVDLERLDVSMALQTRLGFDQQWDLDRLVPSAIELASGRRVRIDYRSDQPVLAARAQDLFGTVEHPCVLDGRLPLVVHVLSPAGRPVQITADLPGFWRGNWSEVRKKMAGRYPKHHWPVDPTVGPQG